MDSRYHYDKKADALYIHLKDGEEEGFEEIMPGINVELNGDDEIIGIEILNASRFAGDAQKKAAVEP